MQAASGSSARPFRAPPPGDPRPAAGALDVWLADLRSLAEDRRELLTPAERARAQRFVRERDRVRWMHARAILRGLLGRYLQQDPHTLRFAAGAHGKPELAEDPARLCFNLSHSGDLALYAFSPDGELGVDVEVARRPLDELALAARALGPSETERLALLEPPLRAQEFLRAWVRHEAALKWSGTGIGGADTIAGASAPWIAELEVGPRAAAAVAAGREPRELRCWSWQS